MSKKRNSNARKKQVAAKRKATAKRTATRTTNARPKPKPALSIDIEAGYEEPDVQTPVEQRGTGAIGAIRSGMTRREHGDDAGTLHKQRSLGEWALWFGGVAVVVWLVLKYIG